MDRKRAKEKKFRIYKRNFFVRFNQIDENILFLFSREFIHSKMLNHWLRGVYTERNRHTTCCLDICIHFFPFAPLTPCTRNTLSVSRVHTYDDVNIEEMWIGWTNRMLICLFELISLITYYGSFVTKYWQKPINWVNDITHRRTQNVPFSLCIHNGNGRQKWNYHAVPFYSQPYY